MKNLFKLSIASIMFTSGFTMTMDISEMRSIRTLFAQKAKEKSTETKTVVPMWGAAHRFHQANHVVNNTMETSGLGGCIATSALVHYENGSSCSVMTHFPPTDTVEHAKQLKRQLLKCNQKAQSSIVSSHLIIAKPNEYVKNEQTGRWEEQLKSNKTDTIFESTHTIAQGDHATSSLLPYSEARLSRMGNYEPEPDLQLAMNQNGNAALYCNICTKYKTDL